MTRRDSEAPLWFCCGLLLYAAAAGRPPVEPAVALAPGPRPVRLDPDALSARELRALPGIGPARAVAVVRARWEGLRGGPAAWRALPGIGDATAGAAQAALSSAAMEPPSQPAYTRPEIP